MWVKFYLGPSIKRWSPPLRLQASHCSTFRIMCDVPSIAVFCSESIECFPGTASRFFLKLLVTIPVAPIITGITVQFGFHIRCVSISKPLYFNLFTAFRDTAVAQWLRCCATNRKVASSIPDGVIGIFHWHNPSDRTMVLGSTQPLTEMSTRSISWG